MINVRLVSKIVSIRGNIIYEETTKHRIRKSPHYKIEPSRTLHLATGLLITLGMYTAGKNQPA